MCSCVLALLCSCVVVFLHSCVLALLCSCILVFMCYCILVLLCSCVIVFLGSCVLAFLCSCFLVFLCSCVLAFFVFLCSSTLVQAADGKVKVSDRVVASSHSQNFICISLFCKYNFQFFISLNIFKKCNIYEHFLAIFLFLFRFCRPLVTEDCDPLLV